MSAREIHPADQLIDIVSSWPHVTTRNGRFDATIFKIGPREIGRVHRSGPVDIRYPKPLRDQLIAEGRTNEYYVAPESNVTTFYLTSTDGIKQTVSLLRIYYLYHVSTLGRTPAGKDLTEVADVKTELLELGLSDELRTVFAKITSCE